MDSVKLEITDEGTIRMLYNEAIDFKEFGKTSIRRASNVEFNNESGCWEVSSAKTGVLLQGGFDSRDSALSWEKEWYSPGGQGWSELTGENEEKSTEVCNGKCFSCDGCGPEGDSYEI